MSRLKRSAGILLHPTSLPGPNGIGEIGEMARLWIDFLARAGQSVWQILPLGPTGYGNSPYQTTSVFAGNPLLIDLGRLVQDGYLPESALQKRPDFPHDRVDYDAVGAWKLPLLLQSYTHFSKTASAQDRVKFDEFCQLHGRLWLDDFSLFMAIKNDQQGRPWNEWPEELKLRDDEAMHRIAARLQNEIQAQKFIQFVFFRHWQELKEYANERGIQVLGDIPIYVTYDSADVWANQDKFNLDEEGRPTVVAGVPPDYFSETGQLWGNPIYRWPEMARSGFKWWIERVRITHQCVDLVRIDHFRGFESYWAVPFGEKTAVNGQWLEGPGSALFDALRQALGDIPIIVEDLGVITPEVETLRDKYGFPGMKILQFAFANGPDDPYLPHNFEKNCVVYTGSHDNDTTVGWFATAGHGEREYCQKYLNCSSETVTWNLIRLAYSSTALLAMVPLQDVLALGSQARMNIPGKPAGNWSWRVTAEQLQETHARNLAELSGIFGRSSQK